ncbi:hypothetical protein GQ53DRAFT_889772, partial [Thozetella sp. PMI_491]
SIIFVHGLRGHPRLTWEDDIEPHIKGPGTSKPSKRKRLSALFKPKPSTLTSDVSSNEHPQKVFWPDEYLTGDMPDARVWTYGYNADAIDGFFQASNKNSVLGGIIVKDAIRRSDECRARTKLIVFLGTPHRGSSSAGWGEIAANFARLALQDPNKKVITTLEVNSEVLDNIHEEFQPIVSEFGIQIHSFQEARGISGMRGLHNKVRCQPLYILSP